MYVEIVDVKPFMSFFDLIYNSATTVELKFDPEKLTMSLLNKGNVCFYNAEYTKDFFNDYQVEGLESVSVDVEDFYKILKSANKNDLISLESDGIHLVCKFEHDGNRRVFELSMIDEDYNSAVPPAIDYEGEFSIALDDLKQPCIDLSKIVNTDKFKMIAQPNKLFIIAPTDTMTNYSQEIDIDYNYDYSCTVNIQYVADLQKLSKINKEVVMMIGDDLPLSWNITSVDDTVKISGLVAPIIENEEE